MDLDRLFRIALAVAAVCIGAWVFTLFERVSGTVDLGYSDEARRNSLLAAQRFISAGGGEATVLRDADEITLPDPSATVILLGPRAHFSGGLVEELLRWVDAGGHLVLSAEHVRSGGTNPDALFAAIGSAVAAADTAAARVRAPRAMGIRWNPADPLTVEFERCTSASDEPAFVTLPALARPLRVYFGGPLVLMDERGAEHTAGLDPELGTSRYLQYYRGRGAVTLLSDAGIWHNDRICYGDHALLLSQLGGDSIHIYVNTRYQDLTEFLWRSQFPSICLAALAVGLWLWSIYPRFGPLVVMRPQAERSMLEHLRAVARFARRAYHHHLLVAALQQDIERRLAARHPDYLRSSRTDRAAKAAALLSVDRDTLGRAMVPPSSGLTDQELLDLVIHLRTYRNLL